MAEQTCRFCRCTDSRACLGGCSWHKPEYCSACAELHLEQLGGNIAQRSWARTGNIDIKTSLGKWPARIERLADSSVAVFDHLGVNILYWMPMEPIAIAPQYDAHELMPLFQTAEARAA